MSYRFDSVDLYILPFSILHRQIQLHHHGFRERSFKVRSLQLVKIHKHYVLTQLYRAITEFKKQLDSINELANLKRQKLLADLKVQYMSSVRDSEKVKEIQASKKATIREIDEEFLPLVYNLEEKQLQLEKEASNAFIELQVSTHIIIVFTFPLKLIAM